VTHNNSSSSRRPKTHNRTATISIRVHVWVLERLREKGITNVSNLVRKLLVKEVEGELTREERLMADLNELRSEMKGLQDLHKTLLAHGSYAKDYLNKLKDGTYVSHRPFKFSKEQNPSISQEEMELVDGTVELREALAKQYREKLRELLTLKKEKYGLTHNPPNKNGNRDSVTACLLESRTNPAQIQRKEREDHGD
jgi:hypothetical protein